MSLFFTNKFQHKMELNHLQQENLLESVHYYLRIFFAQPTLHVYTISYIIYMVYISDQ